MRRKSTLELPRLPPPHASRLPRLLPLLAALSLLSACPNQSQVVVKLQGAETDALVTINDRYVDKLSVLAKRGIKLPPGTYRITVEQVGFFPWDQLVEVDEQPLQLQVDLVPIPD